MENYDIELLTEIVSVYHKHTYFRYDGDGISYEMFDVVKDSTTFLD